RQRELERIWVSARGAPDFETACVGYAVLAYPKPKSFTSCGVQPMLLEALHELAAKQHAADGQKGQEPVTDQGAGYRKQCDTVWAIIIEIDRHIPGDGLAGA